MHTFRGVFGASLVLLTASATPARGVELRVSRKALERTLKAQLFNGRNGRDYLKGSFQSPCSIYAEDPRLTFVQDRIVVEVKTHARVGTATHGACLGVSLAPTSEVSLAQTARARRLGFGMRGWSGSASSGSSTSF